MSGTALSTIRSWLFGPAADAKAHAAMQASGADALIADLEDFTLPEHRENARAMLPALLQSWRGSGRVAAVRINNWEDHGLLDLHAAMAGRPDAILFPKTVSAVQMRELDAAISQAETAFKVAAGSVAIVPVCETALGVVELRAIAAGSCRIRAALLGAEDLAADLCAERTRGANELEYARRRFLLECRAAGIEPIDAPYSFSDLEGLLREAGDSKRLGYHSKSLVRCDHAATVNAVFTPSADEIARAKATIEAFQAARARGEERALVDGLWVEMPRYRNSLRLIERAGQFSRHPASGARLPRAGN
jgi:citrate lyase subunit beta/citryl-CoA lyase